VYRAKNRNDHSIVVAIKVIDKRNLDEDELKDTMMEVEFLQSVDHPNIVRYHETYDDERYLYLIMENCPGGELFDSLEQFEKNGEPYTEEMAAEIIQKILLAL